MPLALLGNLPKLVNHQGRDFDAFDGHVGAVLHGHKSVPVAIELGAGRNVVARILWQVERQIFVGREFANLTVDACCGLEILKCLNAITAFVGQVTQVVGCRRGGQQLRTLGQPFAGAGFVPQFVLGDTAAEERAKIVRTQCDGFFVVGQCFFRFFLGHFNVALQLRKAAFARQQFARFGCQLACRNKVLFVRRSHCGIVFVVGGFQGTQLCGARHEAFDTDVSCDASCRAWCIT